MAWDDEDREAVRHAAFKQDAAFKQAGGGGTQNEMDERRHGEVMGLLRQGNRHLAAVNRQLDELKTLVDGMMRSQREPGVGRRG